MCIYGHILFGSAKVETKAVCKRGETIFAIAFYRFFDDSQLGTLYMGY
jgi:hypothetical protein